MPQARFWDQRHKAAVWRLMTPTRTSFHIPRSRRHGYNLHDTLKPAPRQDSYFEPVLLERNYVYPKLDVPSTVVSVWRGWAGCYLVNFGVRSVLLLLRIRVQRVLPKHHPFALVIFNCHALRTDYDVLRVTSDYRYTPSARADYAPRGQELARTRTRDDLLIAKGAHSHLCS